MQIKISVVPSFIIRAYTHLDLAENNHNKSWVANVCGNNIYGLVATTGIYATMAQAASYNE